jgi:TonB family protein
LPTTAQEEFKGQGRRRLAWSTLAALVGLLMLALIGPSRESIRQRFEFSGAEGPLRLMPELSIEKGEAARYQDPEYFKQNPPPPNVEVVPDNPVDIAEQEKPLPRDGPPVESDEYADALADPDLNVLNAVEMNLPQQTNPWFVLLSMVRPQYPSGATETERRIPVIVVEVAFYVNEEGKVTHSYILSSTGGQTFNEVVLRAVNQWLYKPISKDGRAPEGFWNRLTIRFRSPYRSSSS